jgi:murein DD-endopeptidase MepM/ murein hydrolase activator NlpD
LIPVDGRISGVYGSQRILNSKPRSTHKGIDIAAPKGTKIYAPSTGRIILIEEDMFFTGKTVIVDHGMGLISIFAHLNSIYIRTWSIC